MNKAAKIFNDLTFWNSSVTNITLDQKAKELNIKEYRGAISRDELKNYEVKKQEAFIINVQESDKGNGTHWFALIRDNDRVYVFCSYGSPPPSDIPKRYPKLTIVTNTFVLQNRQVYCGAISLYVIYSYFKVKRDFYAIVLQIKRSYEAALHEK